MAYVIQIMYAISSNLFSFSNIQLMKESRYNVFFKHEGLMIGYNCLSAQYLALNDLLYESFLSCAKRNALDEISDIHPDFYHELEKCHFIVENDINELQMVLDTSFAIDNNEENFLLHINPTMNCNFKCWYCYEDHIKDSRMSEEMIEKVMVFVDDILERPLLKNFELSWFGGEPLLYFDRVMVPILSYAHSACKERGVNFSSGITTNGLLVNENVLELSKKYNLSSFQITLDGNREQHNKVRFISAERGSYDEIVKNIIALAIEGITVHVRLNCSPATFEGLSDILDDFKGLEATVKQFITFDFHAVWQDTKVVTEHQLNEFRFEFRGYGFRVRGGVYDTVVNSCYGDKKNHVTLNYNGDAYKCTARDFTPESREGYIDSGGSLIWNEKYKKRLSAKYKNKPCLECRILPLCGGGCSQQALEHEGIDYCVHDFDEDSKLQAVKNKFLELIDYRH